MVQAHLVQSCNKERNKGHIIRFPGKCGFGSTVYRYCNDFQDYLCKYFVGKGPATSVFNELLAAEYLQLWGLKVPDYEIVEVQKHHLTQISYPYHFFERPCFGSKYGKELKEVDKFFIRWNPPKEKLNLILLDFLKIGLFDLWVSNDDRNFNNLNLLYDYVKDELVPIDHVAIFNGNALDREPYQLAEEDSILTSPFMNGLFSRTLQQNLQGILNIIEEDFLLSIDKCYENIEHIHQITPPEWLIDSAEVNSRLTYLFSESWKSKCLTSFNTFLQIILNR